MNVIVVGCGRVGSELAYNLFKRGHKVTVLDSDPKAFTALPAEFRGRTLFGDVLSKELLERAEIQHADALAAVTPNDAVNIVVGHAARELYEVKNIVVRNYEPHRRPLQDQFQLEVVSPSVWGAERVEELLWGRSLRTVFWAGGGEVEGCEFTVPEGWGKRSLRSILPAEGVRLLALTRAGHATQVDESAVVEAGDVVTLTATQHGAELLRELLQQLEEV